MKMMKINDDENNYEHDENSNEEDDIKIII